MEIRKTVLLFTILHLNKRANNNKVLENMSYKIQPFKHFNLRLITTNLKIEPFFEIPFYVFNFFLKEKAHIRYGI